MIEKIPDFLLKKLRFLPDFTEPIPFRSLTTAERLALMPEQLYQPDPNSVWVWYGQYHKGVIAQHNNLMVQRELYKIFIDPALPSGKKLTNHFTTMLCDVNPFKCDPAITGGSHINLRKQNDFHEDLQNFASRNTLVTEEQARKCLDYIREAGYDSFGDDDIRMFMVSEGYPPPVIEEAINLLRRI